MCVSIINMLHSASESASACKNHKLSPVLTAHAAKLNFLLLSMLSINIGELLFHMTP